MVSFHTVKNFWGINLSRILKLATDHSNSVPDVRKENVKALTVNLQGALRFYRRLEMRHLRPHKICRFLNLYYKTYYVTLIYFAAKIAFLINVAVQLRLLNMYFIVYIYKILYSFQISANRQTISIRLFGMDVTGQRTRMGNDRHVSTRIAVRFRGIK